MTDKIKLHPRRMELLLESVNDGGIASRLSNQGPAGPLEGNALMTAKRGYFGKYAGSHVASNQ